MNLFLDTNQLNSIPMIESLFYGKLVNYNDVLTYVVVLIVGTSCHIHKWFKTNLYAHRFI